MKLRNKFLLITFLSVIQVAVLSTLSLTGFRIIQSAKDYQLIQTRTQKQLIEIINYLDAMEYWGFDTQSAYTNWEEIIDGLDGNIEAYFDSSIVKQLPGEYQISQIQARNYFTAFSLKLSSVEKKLSDMQDIQLSDNASVQIRSFGIRDSYKFLSDDETVVKVMTLAEIASADITELRRNYNLLSPIMDQASELID